MNCEISLDRGGIPGSLIQETDEPFFAPSSSSRSTRSTARRPRCRNSASVECGFRNGQLAAGVIGLEPRPCRAYSRPAMACSLDCWPPLPWRVRLDASPGFVARFRRRSSVPASFCPRRSGPARRRDSRLRMASSPAATSFADDEISLVGVRGSDRQGNRNDPHVAPEHGRRRRCEWAIVGAGFVTSHEEKCRGLEEVVKHARQARLWPGRADRGRGRSGCGPARRKHATGNSRSAKSGRICGHGIGHTGWSRPGMPGRCARPCWRARCCD